MKKIALALILLATPVQAARYCPPRYGQFVIVRRPDGFRETRWISYVGPTRRPSTAPVVPLKDPRRDANPNFLGGVSYREANTKVAPTPVIVDNPYVR